MENVLPSKQFILNKRLFKAVVRNDVRDIHRLISLKADVNAQFTANEMIKGNILDEFAISIIHKDSRFFKRTGQHTVIEKENANTAFNLSPLQLAILYGWKEVIIELIKKGANPNQAIDIYHVWTNLHLMHSIASIFKTENYSIKSSKEIIQLLFDYGADPNIQDNFGATSLHAAVNIQNSDDFEEYIKGIELFLINGADPFYSDSFGTVLWYVVENMEPDDVESERTIKLILDHASDAMDSKLSHKFILHIVNNLKLIQAIKSKNKSVVETLLNKGTSPNIRDTDGLSALHLSVKLEDYVITELLLKSGANPNIKSWKNGTTPLFNAVTNNWLKMAELLLMHAANPSVINIKGLSPLYFSIIGKNKKMIHLLLKYRVNPDISHQISVLFKLLNEAKTDNLKLIENTLEKIKDITIFLKGKRIDVDYTLFYESIEIAEENNKKITASKIMELLDELESKYQSIK